MINGQFSGEGVFSKSSEAFELYEKSRYGEKVGGRIEYLTVEALFLIDEGRMEVYFKERELNFDEILKKFKGKDKSIETKFAVFRDLRKRGYIVKTALKFGAEFRVYEKGIRPGENHAKWILQTVRDNESMKWHDFTARNRVAHSTKKNLLIAIVDEEKDVSYYQCQWIKI